MALELNTDLEDLKGVGESIASRLRRAGFPTVESVAVVPISELVERAGIGKETAMKVSVQAREMINAGLITASELHKKRMAMRRCSTGSQELNDLLGGGVETQNITEFYGEFGTGKTQICLNLSVIAQQSPEEDGLGGRVLYLDTENTFNTERICEIADARGLDAETVLDNIQVAKVYNSDHLLILVDALFKICLEEGVSLVVVDSIISHLRGEYLGRESLAPRQQKLNLILHKLLRIADAYNIAVVVTNQVHAKPDAFFRDPTNPTGGHILAHICNQRVYLKKGRNNERKAFLIDSSYLPPGEASFMITARGVEDIIEQA